MNGTQDVSTLALSVSGLSSGDSLLDDLIRRELRVGDPRNPQEVASALARRYPAATVKLDEERAGFSTGGANATFQKFPAPAAGVGDAAGDREYRRVRDNLEADLNALIQAPGNREWKPELTGWRGALLREYADGAAAARFAQDPAKRERAFFSVRRLGEYARLSRLVGVMNLELNPSYRRLSTTLDEAANALRVLMGEALFDAGLGEGGLIIQVPLVDLRQRRDGVMNALRRLTGVAPDDTGDGNWGDDAAAYGQLLSAIDGASAPELKVYLRPEMLGPILDGLVGAVSRQDPEALRQVAATAPVEVNRLNRLYLVAKSQVDAALQAQKANPQLTVSAGLSSFVQNLKLLLDAFLQSRAGARLVDLAVPLPLAAQQLRDADRESRTILRELVNLRGAYSAEVECFLGCCGCAQDDLRTQVKLDKVLYDVDRAIDLYAQGQGQPDSPGDEEKRAAVYGKIAGNLGRDRSAVGDAVAWPIICDSARAALEVLGATAEVADDLGNAAYAFDLRTAADALGDALDAAEVWASSESLAEGELRKLSSVPDFKAFSKPIHTCIQGIVDETRNGFAGIGLAIKVGVDVIQATAGDVGTVTVANVPIGAITGTSDGLVGIAMSGMITGSTPPVAPTSALGCATAGINAAASALRKTVLALDDDRASREVQRKAAGSQGTAALDAADRILSLLGKAPPPTGEDRLMLLAARSAAQGSSRGAVSAGEIDVSEDAPPVPLTEALQGIEKLLVKPLDQLGTEARTTLLASVFSEQLRGEEDWQALVGSLAPRCLGPGRVDLVRAGRELLHGSQPSYRFVDPEPIGPTAVPPARRVGIAQIGSDFDAVVRAVLQKLTEMKPGTGTVAGTPTPPTPTGSAGGGLAPTGATPTRPSFSGQDKTDRIQLMALVYVLLESGNDEMIKDEGWNSWSRLLVSGGTYSGKYVPSRQIAGHTAAEIQPGATIAGWCSLQRDFTRAFHVDDWVVFQNVFAPVVAADSHDRREVEQQKHPALKEALAFLAKLPR